MKKSKIDKLEYQMTHRHVSVPSIEDIGKDMDSILSMLESIDTMNLSINADASKLSKDIVNNLENMSKKYESLIDQIEEDTDDNEAEE